MNVTFILAVLFALIALAAFAGARANQRNFDARMEQHDSLRRRGLTNASGPKKVSARAALVPGVAAVLLLVWACTTVVVAAVGVPVTFGKVGSPMEPGLHLKSPVTKVETYPIRNSDAITLGGNQQSIVVKTAEQGQLSVKVTLSYRIEPKRAADIYLVARDSDKLRDNIVVPYATQGVVAAFSKLTNDEATASKLATLPDLVRAEVEAALEKQGVEVVTLTVGAPVPSESLQTYIDNKLGALQKRDQAKIDQERGQIENQTKVNAAQAQADANRTIADSTTPETLCQSLIDTIREKGNVGVVMANPCGATDGQVIVQAPAPK